MSDVNPNHRDDSTVFEGHPIVVNTELDCAAQDLIFKEGLNTGILECIGFGGYALCITARDGCTEELKLSFADQRLKFKEEVISRYELHRDKRRDWVVTTYSRELLATGVRESSFEAPLSPFVFAEIQACIEDSEILTSRELDVLPSFHASRVAESKLRSKLRMSRQILNTIGIRCAPYIYF